MNILVTKNKFFNFYSKNVFSKKQSLQDCFLITYSNSYLKCVIQKNKTGVQIIYLDSYYEYESHMINLIGYATFVIAREINNDCDFETIEFNHNGEIIIMQ